MSKVKNVPEIRFNGFSGEWVENNLGGLAEIVRGASPRPIEDPKWFDKSSNVGWLRIRDVTEQDGRIHYLEQRISRLGQEKTRVLFEQTLLLSIAASVGKPVINYVETGVHDGFLIFRKPRFELEFMYQWLKSFEIKWQQYGQPGSQVNLNSDIVKNQVVFTPFEKEQTQIGNTFQKLDNLINQHQQKHDKLSNIKKAMLEKIFPKQGETIPEIRFKGFSGEWQEKEFSSIATRVSTQHQNRCLPCVEYEDIVAGEGRLNKDIFQKVVFKAGLKFEVNDVLYGKLRPYLRNWLLADFNGIAVGDFWVLRAETVAKKFLFYLIQTNRFELISNLSAGSKMPRSDWGLVSKSSFYVPMCISESQKIGNYFQKLDQLIKQHQQQITKLTNIKQACLSKMFV